MVFISILDNSAIGRQYNQQSDDHCNFISLYPRNIESVLKVALADTPVVCLLGPRQVGKTTLVQRLKPKKAYISFIEQGRNVWGVEVKRSASVQEKDGAGLARLSAQAGKNFQGGIILYTGANCLPLKVAKSFAVPMDRLWS